MFQSFIESLARFIYQTSVLVEGAGDNSNFEEGICAVESFEFSSDSSINLKGHLTSMYGNFGSPEEGFR